MDEVGGATDGGARRVFLGPVKATKVGRHRVRGGDRSPRGPKTPPINDPSAGSPTETLLRLLLPLNDQV